MWRWSEVVTDVAAQSSSWPETLAQRGRTFGLDPAFGLIIVVLLAAVGLGVVTVLRAGPRRRLAPTSAATSIALEGAAGGDDQDGSERPEGDDQREPPQVAEESRGDERSSPPGTETGCAR